MLARSYLCCIKDLDFDHQSTVPLVYQNSSPSSKTQEKLYTTMNEGVRSLKTNSLGGGAALREGNNTLPSGGRHIVIF